MRYGVLLALAALSSAVTGCHYHHVRAPDPVTTEEIIRWTKGGVPPDEIIRRIEDSRTVYRMDSKDVVDLHNQGVDQKVIDHMLETERRHIERRSRDPWHHHHCDPYWCPYHSPVHIGFGWYF
ncbi:MAG: hypothetical protein HY721_06980 [Planctomycetes bacterium]|nr:hypothetical protein [Planctomycetota bacterium]